MSASPSPSRLSNARDVRVGFQVKPGERSQILGQEFADPKGILRVARTDDAQAGEITWLAEKLPAGDESLQDNVTQFRVMIEKLPKCIGGQLVNLTVAPGDGFHQRRTAGHLCYFASEFTGLKHRDDMGRIPGLVYNLDLTRLNDKEIAVAIAHPEQLFSSHILLEHRQGTATQRIHFRLAQLGKGVATQVILLHGRSLGWWRS